MADSGVEVNEAKARPEGAMPPTIAKAILKLQKTLSPLKKTAVNTGFNSSYVPLEEVMTEALKMLTNEGVGVTQSPVTDESGFAALETTLFTGSGATYSRTTKLSMNSNKVDPQTHGSAITYMRRYALMAMLGLTGEGEDDDANKASGVSVPVTKEDLARIRSLCMAMSYPPESIEQQIFNVKTHDHALLTIAKLEKNVSMRARDNESKQNATDEEARNNGAHIDVEDGDDSKPPVLPRGLKTASAIEHEDDTDPKSITSFRRRLKALKLSGKEAERKIIVAATKAPWLEKVMEDPEKVDALHDHLKLIETGMRPLDPDDLAPTDEEQVVEVPIA